MKRSLGVKTSELFNEFGDSLGWVAVHRESQWVSDRYKTQRAAIEAAARYLQGRGEIPSTLIAQAEAAIPQVEVESDPEPESPPELSLEELKACEKLFSRYVEALLVLRENPTKRTTALTRHRNELCRLLEGSPIREVLVTLETWSLPPAAA